MSIKGLSVDADVETPNADTLGGGFVKPTGLYGCIVDLAYLSKAASGAMALNLHLKVASDKSIIRQTLYVTTGDSKGNRNYYTTAEGKKKLLAGMAMGELISTITTEKPLAKHTPEEKTVNLYDFTAQAEKPTKVDALTEMIGKPILVGLHKVRTNKVTKDGKGGYNTLAEERFVNEIDKVFYPDGASVTEKKAKSPALFHKSWQDKYDADFVREDYKAVAATKIDSLTEAEAPVSSDLFS